MRTKGPGIAPWSFYKADPLDNLIDFASAETHHTLDPNKPHSISKEMKLDKDYEKINKKKIQTIHDDKKQKSPQKSANTINGYCPIISTSLELLETRDRVMALNEKYLLIVAIRESLKNEVREKDCKMMREKYECLFPILKPRESAQVPKQKSSLRSQSQLFLDDYLKRNPSFS